MFYKTYFRYIKSRLLVSAVSVFLKNINEESSYHIFQERLRGQYCVRDPNGGVPILGSFERNNGNGNGPPNWSGLDVRNFNCLLL